MLGMNGRETIKCNNKPYGTNFTHHLMCNFILFYLNKKKVYYSVVKRVNQRVEKVRNV